MWKLQACKLYGVCSNYDESAIDKHLLFRERVSKEAYKIDLHTPQALRDAGRCMTAQQASTAASVWLGTLYKHMGKLHANARHACLMSNKFTLSICALTQ